MPSVDLWANAAGLAAALGGGLLIGLERERRKRGTERGPGRPPAGIRSFALAALGGGIAQTLQQPLLVALGAAMVAVLVGVAYWASRQAPPPGAPPPDPGLTTELALFVTYLVGVLSVQQPALGAAAAAVVATLLAARERLHRFATRALSDAEWHDALLLAVLVGVAYWASRQAPPPGAPPPDPGLTTELALFVTYLVGVLAVQQPALGAAAAAVVATLLAARERLHRFATRALSDAEWHDALLLAALVLVLLPLAPATPLPGLAGLNARALLGLMTLILALQAAGHVALRLLGPRAGLAGSGAMSGFVSSTATIASMGAKARAEPALAPACTAGAIFSTAATWVQAMLLLAATSPPAAALLAPAALAGLLVAGLTGGWVLRQAPMPDADAARPGPTAAHATPTTPGPLRLREALIVTVLLAAVAVAVTWAQGRFGSAGLLASTALGALADAHAPVAALGALAAAGQIDATAVRDGTLVAVAANACTRSITAFVAGGRAYGLRVAASLLVSTLVATGTALALA